MVRGVDIKTSTKEFINIIKAVQKRPSLYHRSLSEHGHDARLQIWNELGQHLNLPAITCKERWRYARSVFVKYTRNENVGQAGENLVKYLHFLKPHITIKKEPLQRKPALTKLKSSKKIQPRNLKRSRKNSKYLDTFTKLQHLRRASNRTVDCEDVTTDLDFLDDEPILEFVYDKRDKTIKEYSVEDADLNFIKSLVFEMKLMSSEQKTEFKLKVVTLVSEALNRTLIHGF